MKGYLILVVFAVLISCANKNGELSYSEVVERMVDLKRLAQLPEKGEESGMFSSYDRKSKYNDLSGTYHNWSANDDGLTPQYIRKEGDNMVLAEMEGPGAIVRIWSANPGKGHVKVFIDGNEAPAIDMPFRDYFNTSTLPAFSYSNLVYETSARGFNNYVPITFQESIKIVAEPEWGQYYHFNYVTFPDKTEVEVFKQNPSDEAKESLQRVNQFFENDLGQRPSVSSEPLLIEETIALQPEEKQSLVIEGKRAISAFNVEVNNIPDSLKEEVLRKTILSVTWDNDNEPAIWSPLGDFFGSAPGYNHYKTLPMGMTEEGMYSFWYMPFESLANIEIQNHSDVPVEYRISLKHEENPFRKNNYGRFHAKWHRDIMPVEEERWPDWTVLKTRGEGRFVGMFLSVWNPKGGHCVQDGGEGQHWWGEGDEKFFVDGEEFPSTYGTGTEDYFGYAWCVPNFFQHAYHSQNYTEDNMGHQSLNRWQIIDNVPFQESFEAYMEKYFPNKWPTQYATVAYWYLNSKGEDLIGTTPVDQLYGYETPYDVYKAKNAVDGEDMKILKNTGGWASNDVFVKETLYNKVSGHKVLIWFGRKNDESVLTTSFSLPHNGQYSVTVNKVQTKDGGLFSFYLNDQLLKEGVDFRSSNDQVPVMEKLGLVKLEEGEQQLKIKWDNTSGSGKRMMLDYLKFEPVK
ncbi:glycoside hydrolase family 172 protein [Marinilabilia sp.]